MSVSQHFPGLGDGERNSLVDTARRLAEEYSLEAEVIQARDSLTIRLTRKGAGANRVAPGRREERAGPDAPARAVKVGS
jgi:hypothetical protein